MGNNGKRKVILSVVLILFLMAMGTLSYRTITYVVRVVKEQSELANRRAETEKKEKERNNFNNQFRSPFGNFSTHFLNEAIDNLINSNKTNPTHPVEFIYNGISCGTDTEKIQKVKEKIDLFKDYDVSFSYDIEGYINQFIVIEQRETPDDFNRTFEHYAGTQPGAFVENLLTAIITNNTKNTDYSLELEFDKKSYGIDIQAIGKIKDELGTFTKYEVSFEYDEDGYIVKVIIVTK